MSTELQKRPDDNLRYARFSLSFLQFVQSIIPIPKVSNSKKKKKNECRCPFVRFYTDGPIII